MGVGPRATLLARRFRGKAEVNQLTTPVESVENDPKRTVQPEIGSQRLYSTKKGWLGSSSVVPLGP